MSRARCVGFDQDGASDVPDVNGWARPSGSSSCGRERRSARRDPVVLAEWLARITVALILTEVLLPALTP